MKNDNRDVDCDDVSDLRSAFRALAADEPPANFLDRVMARAAQEPLHAPEIAEAEPVASNVLRLDRGRKRQWLQSLISVPGVAALAACLLLSLAANIWLGARMRVGPWFGSKPLRTADTTHRQRQDFRAFLADLNPGAEMVGFNVRLFQLSLHATDDLGRLVTAHPALETRANTLSFAGTSGFYAMGALYAEALAYLHGGQWETAAQRLSSMERELRRLPVAGSLADYVHTLRQAVQQRRYDAEVLGKGFEGLQSLAETSAAQQGREFVLLFRVGAWLVNMKLAALSEDLPLLLRGDMTPYFSHEFSALQAPEDLLMAFETLDRLVEPAMTAADSHKVVTAITQLQRLLE